MCVSARRLYATTLVKYGLSGVEKQRLNAPGERPRLPAKHFFFGGCPMRIPSHAAALFAAALLLGAGAGPTTASPAAQANSNVSLHGVDLERSTIPDLQKAMDRRRISSLELTIFYLARIRQLNPDLNAVITTSPTALVEAVLSDIRRITHQLRGPMDGIPILLKDNVDTTVM